MHALRPGDRIGEHYRIHSYVAGGGFGEVYIAEDGRRQALVALKTLHADLLASPDAVARFEREMRALERLRHTGIVQVLDRCVEPPMPYLAMELLSGESLSAWLKRSGRMDVWSAAALVAELAAALDHAHAAGVIHRDIKSSNVQLTGESERRAVLLDFGIAKLLDDEEPLLTTSRQVVGTPGRLSPEQALGRPVDARTDVYLLGVLAFELLTGSRAFDGGTLPETRRLHATAPRPVASARAPVSADVDEVLMRAMAVDPNARFASAGELARALAAAARPRAEARAGELIGLLLRADGETDAIARTRAEVSRMLDRHGFVVAFDVPGEMLLIGAREQAGDLAEVVACLKQLVEGSGLSAVLHVADGARTALGGWSGEIAELDSWATVSSEAGLTLTAAARSAVSARGGD